METSKFMGKAEMVIILLGPPGSGKGTQAAFLAGMLGLVSVSTGETLRRECASGSALGEQVQALLNAGFLVGNDLMNQVVAQRISEPDCQEGCILDGYPRTIEQAIFLNHALVARQTAEPIVFDFVVTPETVIERLSQRRQCPGCGKIYSAEFDVYGKDLVCDLDGFPLVRRSDDNPRAIRERLQIYGHNSGSLVEFYKPRRYYAVDAMQPPDSISAELMRYLA